MCDKSLLLNNRSFFFRIVICSGGALRLLTCLILRRRVTASLVLLLLVACDDFGIVYIVSGIVIVIIVYLILKRDSHVQWQRAHRHQSRLAISACREARRTLMWSLESIHIVVDGNLLVFNAVSLVWVWILILWLI